MKCTKCQVPYAAYELRDNLCLDCLAEFRKLMTLHLKAVAEVLDHGLIAVGVAVHLASSLPSATLQPDLASGSLPSADPPAVRG